jgi:hypothetical protein
MLLLVLYHSLVPLFPFRFLFLFFLPLFLFLFLFLFKLPVLLNLLPRLLLQPPHHLSLLYNALDLFVLAFAVQLERPQLVLQLLAEFGGVGCVVVVVVRAVRVVYVECDRIRAGAARRHGVGMDLFVWMEKVRKGAGGGGVPERDSVFQIATDGKVVALYGGLVKDICFVCV